MFSSIKTFNGFKIAGLIWVICFLIISLIDAINGHTLVPIEIQASQNWFMSQSIYEHIGAFYSGVGFLYFPQSAILFFPFSKLPLWFSILLWRGLGLSVLAYGIYRFSSLNFNLSNNHKHGLYFLVISLLCLAIGSVTIINGQFNIVIVCLGILSVVDVIEKHWWRTALYLVLGLSLKPTMIVLLLLLTALYRPLWWRVPLLLLLAMLLPFLTQSYDYVINQYLSMYHMFISAASLGSTQTKWAQLFGLISDLTHYFVSVHIQNFVRVIFAMITLYLAWYSKRHFSPQKFAVTIYSLAAIYLMLFNPRTENNDYIILAPAIGYFLADAIFQKNILQQVFFGIICVILLEGYYIEKIVVIPGKAQWISPLVGLTFSIWFIYALFIKSPNNYDFNQPSGYK